MPRHDGSFGCRLGLPVLPTRYVWCTMGAPRATLGRTTTIDPHRTVEPSSSCRSAIPCPTDNGYVMVGDPSNNNEAVHFRNVSSLDRGDRGGMISHPDGEHVLFKVEPVAFPGFHPAIVSRNPEGVQIGQGVTIVGYEMSRPTGTTRFLGKPYEAQLEVVDQREMGFWFTGGAYGGVSSLLALELAACRAHLPNFTDAGAGGAMPIFDEAHLLLGIAIGSGTTKPQ